MTRMQFRIALDPLEGRHEAAALQPILEVSSGQRPVVGENPVGFLNGRGQGPVLAAHRVVTRTGPIAPRARPSSPRNTPEPAPPGPTRPSIQFSTMPHEYYRSKPTGAQGLIELATVRPDARKWSTLVFTVLDGIGIAQLGLFSGDSANGGLTIHDGIRRRARKDRRGPPTESATTDAAGARRVVDVRWK